MRGSTLVAALVLVCGISWCLAGGNPKAPAAKKKAATKPSFTISKETTVITAPLRPDGYPDYLAAVNERCRKGVTPENNAAVLFLKAMGLGDAGKQYRDRYCKALGIEPLADDHTYFVSLDKYAGMMDQELWKQFDLAQRRPWKTDEFPLIAGWLEENKPSIDLVVEASRRPRWYSPMISDKETVLLGVALPVVDHLREAGRCVAARAMERIQGGKIDQAWADLLAGHRLARLTGQGPTLIEALVAMTLEGKFCEADRALLQDARLTADQITRMRANLAKLPPPADLADKLDSAERFMYSRLRGDARSQGAGCIAGHILA